MKAAIVLLGLLAVIACVQGRSVVYPCYDEIYDDWEGIFAPMPRRPWCDRRRCIYTTCPRYPGAECREPACPFCPVEFYYHGRRVYDCDIRVCPYHYPRVHCYSDPCAYAKCTAYPEAVCRRDYCGFCKARFYVAGREVNCEPRCPLDKPYTECKTNPCDVSTCPRYPDADCRPDYCGGCHAVYSQSSIPIASCKKRTPIPSCDSTLAYCQKGMVPGDKNQCSLSRRCADDEYCCHNGCYNQCKKRFPSCPNDKPKVECVSDPCLYAKCKGYPNAVCKANVCGECKAEFYLRDELVRCDVPNCPPPLANPIVSFCLADSCDKDKPCPEDRYCCFSGCSNTCLLKPTPPPPSCPADKPKVQCTTDPCLYAVCRGYPKAVCKANYCGECKAEFFESGKQVQCSIPLCPYPLINPHLARCLPFACSETKPCHPWQHCCFNGCGNTCRDIPNPKCPFTYVSCNSNPCKAASCDGYPTAECKVNNCASKCTAEFYVGDQKVQCGSGCPVDRQPVTCAVDPCQNAICNGRPSAVCKPDNCGECRARFYIGNVELKCNPKYPPPNCPAAFTQGHGASGPCLSDCLEDSDCSSGTCCYNGCGNVCLNIKPLKGICPYIAPVSAGHQTDCTDQCSDDYSCSGYQVCCSVGCRKECVMGVPAHPTCDKPMALCSKDPCEGETCGGIPGIACRSSYCGGCIAEWFNVDTRHYCN